MRVLAAIVVAYVVMAVIEAGIRFGLPLVWFSTFDTSVPPDDKAAYLGEVLGSVWLFSAAAALSGFIGMRIFVAIGHISKFSYVALFAGLMFAAWFFGTDSYWSGSIVAVTGVAFSLFGGYLGLKNPPNQSLKSGTPQSGAP